MCLDEMVQVEAELEKEGGVRGGGSGVATRHVMRAGCWAVNRGLKSTAILRCRSATRGGLCGGGFVGIVRVSD